jgi:hypothetical protein
MEPIAIALFALCAALIGFFGLVFWGFARMAGEELERSREQARRD